MLEDEWIYVVEEGDTVDEIAAKTGRPVGELIWANQLEYPYRLAVGQSLYVGAEGSIWAGSPLLYSFGYAYPFIDRDTLDETLPFLTDIYIFSYGFTAEGNLVSPHIEDTPVIQSARTAGVRPVMVLTPLGPDGRFNNRLITELLSNDRAVRRLVWQLMAVIEQKEWILILNMCRPVTGSGLRSLSASVQGCLGHWGFLSALPWRQRPPMTSWGFSMKVLITGPSAKRQTG